MSLREQFTDQLKASMKAGNAPRTSTLRMILARLKDIDIAARPKGIERVPDEEIVGMLRGMVKSRRELVELYRQGHRQDLVDKEEAEIAVIETFLPQQMDEARWPTAVAAAIAETGAASIKDMGKVMAALRAKHAATLDMAKAGPMVKARLGKDVHLMALPAGFLDELRARTPLAAIVGRRVRLARSGRQWKGCCPFHGEKTPSFYVYEDGHYHCFGCGAHGDAIGFVMQSEGAGFMEAVERLAAEAGLEVPKPSPEAAEAEQKRLDLAAVLEAAQASYQRRLFLPEGPPRAGLSARPWPDRADDPPLRPRLVGRGPRGAGRRSRPRGHVPQDQLVDAGLMRRDDETGRAFDLFFNRVMFPIRDRRGRVISFGGRILGDGQPKYVNGPETALFSKRRTLYALDLAREAVRGGAPLVVVEGYMDVIALAQAGIGGAVAPLGTALTEEQLEELWRLAPAPILCFDGDAAGSRAAARAAELALPLLAPDRTLRLARLPAGEDPDTLVRRQGATACAPCCPPRRRWPKRCSTCCARPAAKRRPSSAPPSARAWRQPRGASPTGRSPANIAARCSTVSSPAVAPAAVRPRRGPSPRPSPAAGTVVRRAVPHPHRHPAAPSRPAARRRARLSRARPAAAARGVADGTAGVGGNGRNP